MTIAFRIRSTATLAAAICCATLARWFGCSAGELPGILPNVGNFTNTSLGFV